MRERHKRQVVILEAVTLVTPAWADLARRAIEAPPSLGVVVDDKCTEHTTDRVAKTIGLAWATTDKLRKEEFTIGPVTTCVWHNLPKLALLDRQADARYAAEDAADLDELAKADARRDAMADEKRNGGPK